MLYVIWVVRSMNQSINESINQSINQLINQLISQSVNQYFCRVKRSRRIPSVVRKSQRKQTVRRGQRQRGQSRTKWKQIECKLSKGEQRWRRGAKGASPSTGTDLKRLTQSYPFRWTRTN